MSNVIHILTRQPLDPVLGAAPRPSECLACYLHRMIRAGDCPGTLAWADHYRQVRARRATALTRRLEHRGACCDCEVVTLVWCPSPALWVRNRSTGDLVEPDELPSCEGVRPGSTEPCHLWSRSADVAL